MVDVSQEGVRGPSAQYLDGLGVKPIQMEGGGS